EGQLGDLDVVAPVAGLAAPRGDLRLASGVGVDVPGQRRCATAPANAAGRELGPRDAYRRGPGQPAPEAPTPSDNARAEHRHPPPSTSGDPAVTADLGEWPRSHAVSIRSRD